MNYQTTNRLLKKDEKKAILFQVGFCLIMAVILLPLTYVWGYYGRLGGFDKNEMTAYFEETIVPIDHSAQPPPTRVARLLFPFGEVTHEESFADNMIVYRAYYPPDYFGNKVSALGNIARKWHGSGLQVSERGEGLVGSSADGVYTATAMPIFEAGIEIFVRERASTKNLPTVGQRLETLGLPHPPNRMTITDLGGSAGGAMVFTSNGRPMNEYRAYDAQLEKSGWKRVESFDDGAKSFPYNFMYRRQNATLMLTCDEAPRGGAILTLVIF